MQSLPLLLKWSADVDRVTDLINENRFRSLNVIKAEEFDESIMEKYDVEEVDVEEKAHEKRWENE